MQSSSLFLVVFATLFYIPHTIALSVLPNSDYRSERRTQEYGEVNKAFVRAMWRVCICKLSKGKDNCQRRISNLSPNYTPCGINKFEEDLIDCSRSNKAAPFYTFTHATLGRIEYMCGTNSLVCTEEYLDGYEEGCSYNRFEVPLMSRLLANSTTLYAYDNSTTLYTYDNSTTLYTYDNSTTLYAYDNSTTLYAYDNSTMSAEYSFVNSTYRFPLQYAYDNSTDAYDNSTYGFPLPYGYDNSTDAYDNSTDAYDNSTDAYDNSTYGFPLPYGYDNSTEAYDNSTYGFPLPYAYDNSTDAYDNSTYAYNSSTMMPQEYTLGVNITTMSVEYSPGNLTLMGAVYSVCGSSYTEAADQCDAVVQSKMHGFNWCHEGHSVGNLTGNVTGNCVPSCSSVHNLDASDCPASTECFTDVCSAFLSRSYGGPGYYCTGLDGFVSCDFSIPCKNENDTFSCSKNQTCAYQDCPVP